MLGNSITGAGENPAKMLDAAQNYLALGYSIIPIHSVKNGCCTCGKPGCTAPGKHPLLESWRDYQKWRPTEAEVRAWWKHWPWANVAIVTGSISGLVVLDIDGPDGVGSVSNKELPNTVIAETGGGGWHYLFRYPHGRVIGNKTGILPKVDVRADGGYIVAPPSIHKSGKTYTWFCEPGETELADIPEWLLELLDKQRDIKQAEPVYKAITEGARNSTMASLAGSMRYRGMSQESITAALEAENLARCSPPLPTAEVARIAASVCRYSPAEKTTTTKNESAAETETKKLSYVQLSDVQPEEVSWLWKPYIPKGKITFIEGDPGIGKSWLSMAMAAGITTGAAFPDAETGRAIFRVDPAIVIYLSAEDGPADTLRPRLDSLGADVSKIYVVTGTQDEKGDSAFSFDDLILLDGMAELLNPALIVIDPLQAYLGAGIDMHRANETRPVLAKLAALAERHNCAVLCIRHLNKGTGGKVLYRGMGSIDFTAAARSVLLAGCDQNDFSKRALIHIKSSLAPAGQAQGYELKDGFFWTGISTLTASELLSNEIQHSKEGNKLEEATTWLTEQLQNGPCEKKDLLELADDAGIKSKTLRRAAEKIGVKSYKKPGKKNGPWLWELPGNDGQDENIPYESMMGKTSTRGLSSNDVASTVCPIKNDGQDMEPNGDKASHRIDDLPKGYSKGKSRLDQDKKGDAWEPNDKSVDSVSIPF